MHWGYLLDQFAMTFMNHRTDEYGGALENRLRCAREILEGIKAACGSGFVVSMRLALKSYIKGYNQPSLHGEDEGGPHPGGRLLCGAHRGVGHEHRRLLPGRGQGLVRGVGHRQERRPDRGAHGHDERGRGGRLNLGLWSFETPAALDELASVTLLGETFPLE